MTNQATDSAHHHTQGEPVTVPAVLPPSLTVAEIFGPTIQGEGPSMGRRATFIRLGGCNLTCDWCDTPYTWDASRFDLRGQMSRWTVSDILDRLAQHRPDRVVITGGEPLLQQSQEGWATLLQELVSRGTAVEVETNGTQIPSEVSQLYVAQFNVSPKLAHGGDPASKRIVPAALEAFASSYKAEFKFVCQTVEDVATVATLARDYGILTSRVWIMPEGVDADTLNDRLALIADAAIAYGFNITTRLHVMTWGNQRGK